MPGAFLAVIGLDRAGETDLQVHPVLRAMFGTGDAYFPGGMIPVFGIAIPSFFVGGREPVTGPV